jgi:hypothetical protein
MEKHALLIRSRVMLARIQRERLAMDLLIATVLLMETVLLVNATTDSNLRVL